MREELKPCPFCGGKAVLFQIPYNSEEELKQHPRWFWSNPGWWTIGCDTEQCIANYNHEMMLFLGSKQAITAWNRRAMNE